MKKFIYSLLSLTTLALSFTACSDDDDDVKNPWVDEGAAAYFATTMPTSYIFEGKATETIPMTVLRVFTDDAVSVNLKLETEAKGIEIPSSVSFAAGEKSATFNVTVKVAEMDFEVVQPVTITLVDDGNVSQWGKSTFTFTVKRLAGWEDLGMATYTDFFLSGLFGISPAVTYEVPIQQNEAIKGLFRLVNAYGEYCPLNDEGDYNPDKTYYLEINCVDPDGVYIEMQQLGNYWSGFGAFIGISYGGYYLRSGKTLEEAKEAGVCGTFKDGVITFKAKTCLTQMPEYEDNPTGLFYGNAQDVTCVLPGY